MTAAGACILAPEGQTLTTREAAFFRDADPWGFILFARNIDTPDQVRRLTGALRDAVGRDAPVFIDQEGGRVQRMGPPHWLGWAPPLDDAARAGTGAETAMALRARIIAAELRSVGIDGNCIPCADIARPDTHPILRNRCYGSDAGTVIAAARAAARGCLDGGVLPVMKHMPGHGRAVVDSHGEVPRVTASPEALRQTDFAVFTALSDLPLGMSAHVIYTALDDRPGTLSPVIHKLIRSEIGFGGLLMTDDISMGALSGSMTERAEAAIGAGCDLVLHCNGDRAEMAAVAEAAGRLTEAGETRADAALAARGSAAPGDFDIAAAVARFEQIMTGQADA
ncbi:MAG: glycoside hydrolase family 3 N-terminal domain-containing protein [Paracoccaceae bacterium]|nr:glycoside hydrolase family 3 N-terminal domain-containing protein [Paracoccaceae bacterium]